MNKKDKINLIVDAAALIAYLVVANPAWTGIGLHEWLGVGVYVVLFVHVLFHMDWVFNTTKRAWTHRSWATTGNWCLDVLIFISLTLCTVAGVLISGDFLPALGLYADGYYFWDPVHSFSAKLLLALLIVHIVVHWKWIVSFFKKKFKGEGVAKAAEDAQVAETAEAEKEVEEA